MIKYITFFTLFFTSLFSDTAFEESFISEYEYGKMLYANPRGISCSKCHGDDAKGQKIINFTHTRNKKKYDCTIKTEDITNISYEKFLQTLDPKLEKPRKKFAKGDICAKLTYGNTMPTYFLTSEELKSIYFYLKNKDKYE